MILLITNKEDITSDFIVNKLNKKGDIYYRLNTEEILTSIDINFDFQKNEFILSDKNKDKIIDLSEITSVYFRRPKLPELNCESITTGEREFLCNEIFYLLEGLYKILEKKFWISPIQAIRNAENKIFQLILAKEFGFTIPKSLISCMIGPSQLFVETFNNCIVKPIKTGFINNKKNPKIIFTSVLTRKQKKSLERVKYCPTFFQNKIEKVADVRVTVVGQRLFPAKITYKVENECQTDWRQMSFEKLHYEKLKLPSKLHGMCIDLLKYLGLRFGAIDFVIDKDGNYLFLEINPNGQWAWIEKRLTYDISGEIINMLLSEGFQNEI